MIVLICGQFSLIRARLYLLLYLNEPTLNRINYIKHPPDFIRLPSSRQEILDSEEINLRLSAKIWAIHG